MICFSTTAWASQQQVIRGWWHWALRCGFCSWLFVVLTGYSQAENEAVIDSFRLADQYDQPHDVTFPTNKVSVIVVADRKGSDQVQSWIQPVVQSFGTNVIVIGVADMSPVPSFLRKWVRKRMAQEWSYPILMDWEGKVVKSFRPQPETVNVYVLDPKGMIRCRAVGKADDKKLQQVSDFLKSMHLSL